MKTSFSAVGLFICLVASSYGQPALSQTDVALTTEKQLRDTVSLWASAWSSQQAERYFEFYTEDFIATGFSNKSNWIEDRTRRLESPQSIRVRLFDFELITANSSAATVRFMLIYERPGYADRTLKELELVNLNGDWRISSEKNIQVQVLDRPA